MCVGGEGRLGSSCPDRGTDGRWGSHDLTLAGKLFSAPKARPCVKIAASVAESGGDSLPSDPSLALFLVALMLCAGAVGAHIGIARARAPLGAPERQEMVDRRLRLKDAHLGQVRWAVILTGTALAAALVYLIVAHA